MCGLVGIYAYQALEVGLLASATKAMADRILHRGPDDSGVWIDSKCDIAFGHRRLSIIDLSPAGHQPMVSSDDRSALSWRSMAWHHPGVVIPIPKRCLRP